MKFFLNMNYDTVIQTELSKYFLLLSDTLILASSEDDILFKDLYLLDYQLSGYFFVVKKPSGKYGMWKVNGKLVLPYEFDWIADPNNWPSSLWRFIPVKRDGKYALYSYSGEKITGFEFDSIEKPKRYSRVAFATKGNVNISLNCNGEVVD